MNFYPRWTIGPPNKINVNESLLKSWDETTQCNSKMAVPTAKAIVKVDQIVKKRKKYTIISVIARESLCTFPWTTLAETI